MQNDVSRFVVNIVPLQNVQTNFWLKDLPEKKTLYFQFNQVFDAENEEVYSIE